MCTRAQNGSIEPPTGSSPNSEESISELSQSLAVVNSQKLIESLENVTSIDSFRTAFITYLDAFQCAFRTQIERKFEHLELLKNEQEPWYTDYVTLKPVVSEENQGPAQDLKTGKFLKAKAQKITKKACGVLMPSSNAENNEENSNGTCR